MERLLTADQIARRLSVNSRLIRAWWRAGRAPAPVRLPDGCLRWRSSEIAAWLAELPAATPGAPSPAPPTDRLATLPELGREIVQVLQEVGREPGGWMPGAEIARRIGDDCDHTSGTWRRVMRQLRDLGLIQSDRLLGYRLC
jgi:predicted DNA-binding transcriptional regulator AlpA